RHDVGRIGTQPEAAGSVTGIDFAGECCGRPVAGRGGEMPLQLGQLAGGTGRMSGAAQRCRHLRRQRGDRETAACRQQQRGPGHRQSRYSTLMISYSRWPAGASMTMESPSFLPIIARATGEEIAIIDNLMSASRSPTIW